MERYCVLLSISLVLIPCVESQSTVSTDLFGLIFTENPRSTSVLKDDMVTLHCRINVSLSAMVYWVGPMGLPIVPSDSNSNTNNVIITPFAGQFDLQILSSQKSDMGEYYCVAEVAADSHVYQSNRATLIVIEPSPLQNDHRCFPDMNIELREGDQILLTCLIVTDNPNVQLIWRKDDDFSDEGGNTERRDSSITVKKLLVSLTSRHHGVKYSCVALDENNHEFRTCYIGALGVMFAPKALIIASANQYVGYNAKYLCDATGNPPPSRMTWFFAGMRLPHQDLPRFIISNDKKMMRIAETMETDDNEIIRCEVSNDVGDGVAYYTVQLESIMNLVGPIAVGIILGLVVLLMCVFLCWWKRYSRRRERSSPDVHVWANGIAVRPAHPYETSQFDGKETRNGNGRVRRYRKGRTSGSASAASTQLAEDELVTQEMLELTDPTGPRSPEDNTAYVYDGSMNGSRPQTPKLWNIPREERTTGEADSGDSGQASLSCSPNNDPTSTESSDQTNIDATVLSSPPTPPTPPPVPDTTHAVVESRSVDSASSFQPIEAHEGSEGLVYADLSFNSSSVSQPPQRDATEYATINFSQREDSPPDTPPSDNSCNISTEL
ncbi:hemicentin-1-like [Saccoglossus kowalevskii]